MGIEALLRKKAEQDKSVEKPTSLVPEDTQPTQPKVGNQPNPSNTPKAIHQKQPTQPERDYTKVANSIVREAIPNKLFKGMSKQTYDVLYKETRGTFPPRRTLQITKLKLEEMTGFSDNTLAKHLKDLKSVGLVKITHLYGKHDGSVYEVLIPEELGLPTQPTQPTQPNPTNPTQHLGCHPPQHLGWVGILKPIENKEVMSITRLSLNKDEETDDDIGKNDVYRRIDALLNKEIRKAIGSGITRADYEALFDIIEQIINETESARSRTKSVSVYLKFAAENLRRRLEVKPKTKPAVSKKLIDVSNIMDIEPLGESRLMILGTLKAISSEQGREAVEALQGNYLPDDWSWLIAELNK